MKTFIPSQRLSQSLNDLGIIIDKRASGRLEKVAVGKGKLQQLRFIDLSSQYQLREFYFGDNQAFEKYLASRLTIDTWKIYDKSQDRYIYFHREPWGEIEYFSDEQQLNSVLSKEAGGRWLIMPTGIGFGTAPQFIYMLDQSDWLNSQFKSFYSPQNFIAACHKQDQKCLSDQKKLCWIMLSGLIGHTTAGIISPLFHLLGGIANSNHNSSNETKPNWFNFSSLKQATLSLSLGLSSSHALGSPYQGAILGSLYWLSSSLPPINAETANVSTSDFYEFLMGGDEFDLSSIGAVFTREGNILHMAKLYNDYIREVPTLYILTKLNGSNGALLESKLFNSSKAEYSLDIRCMSETTDGSIILVGIYEGGHNYNRNIAILKLFNDGTLSDAYTLNDSNEINDACVMTNSNNEMLVYGNDYERLFYTKLSSHGDILWTVAAKDNYSGYSVFEYKKNIVKAMPDGNIAIAINAFFFRDRGFGSLYIGSLTNLDNNGAVIWSKIFLKNDELGSFEIPGTMVILPGTQEIVLTWPGYSYYFYLVRFDFNGKLMSTDTISIVERDDWSLYFSPSIGKIIIHDSDYPNTVLLLPTLLTHSDYKYLSLQQVNYDSRKRISWSNFTLKLTSNDFFSLSRIFTNPDNSFLVVSDCADKIFIGKFANFNSLRPQCANAERSPKFDFKTKNDPASLSTSGLTFTSIKTNKTNIFSSISVKNYAGKWSVRSACESPSKRSNYSVIIGSVVGVIVPLLLLVSGYFLYRYREKLKLKQAINQRLNLNLFRNISSKLKNIFPASTPDRATRQAVHPQPPAVSSAQKNPIKMQNLSSSSVPSIKSKEPATSLQFAPNEKQQAQALLQWQNETLPQSLKRFHEEEINSQAELLKYQSEQEALQQKFNNLQNFPQSEPQIKELRKKIDEIDHICQELKSHLANTIAKQQAIAEFESDPNLSKFYRRMHIGLEAIFIGCKTIASKLVTIDHTGTAGKAAGVFEGLSGILELIPGLGSILKSITAGVSNVLTTLDKKQQTNLINTISNLGTLADMEKIAEMTARKLTESYCNQLKLLPAAPESAMPFFRQVKKQILKEETLSAAEKLADIGIMKILSALLDATVDLDQSLETQFIQAVAKHPAKTEAIINAILSTIATNSIKTFAGDWYLADIYCKPGIKTRQEEYYISSNNNVELYGYRLGTEEEAIALDMHKQDYETALQYDKRLILVKEMNPVKPKALLPNPKMLFFPALIKDDAKTLAETNDLEILSSQVAEMREQFNQYKNASNPENAKPLQEMQAKIEAIGANIQRLEESRHEQAQSIKRLERDANKDPNVHELGLDRSIGTQMQISALDIANNNPKVLAFRDDFLANKQQLQLVTEEVSILREQMEHLQKEFPSLSYKPSVVDKKPMALTTFTIFQSQKSDEKTPLLDHQISIFNDDQMLQKKLKILQSKLPKDIGKQAFEIVCNHNKLYLTALDSDTSALKALKTFLPKILGESAIIKCNLVDKTLTIKMHNPYQTLKLESFLFDAGLNLQGSAKTSASQKGEFMLDL